MTLKTGIMKKLLIAALLVALSTTAFCSVYIKYENKDSRAYTMKVRMDGSDKEVKFEKATSTVTIQGGGTVCIIETSCGKVEVKSGDKVIIKDGCLKKD
jgi:hypothetical protein